VGSKLVVWGSDEVLATKVENVTDDRWSIMKSGLAECSRDTETSLQVHVYERPEELQEVVSEWEDLLVDFPGASIFSTWEWLGPWWRAYGTNRKLRVLAFRDSSSRLVALAPLSVTSWASRKELSLVRLMGDGSGDSDNLDLPVRAGYEEPFARALLDYLETQTDSLHHCEFNTMPVNSPVGNALLGELERRSWKHFVYSIPCAVISLPITWEDYLQQIPKLERRNLRYQRTQLESRYKARFYSCKQSDELATCLEKLFELHRKRWQMRGESGTLGSPARRQFYYDVANCLILRGWLEFWLLELDGKTVAAEFNFRYRDTVFCLQSGFDPQYSTASVGFLLRGHVIREMIGLGIRRLDLLAGMTRHKERLGATRENYICIHFAKPCSRGSLYLRRVNDFRRVKDWLRRRLPRPMWVLLHRLNVLSRFVFAGDQARGSERGVT
jgi:CelD/BcsL family acetyltransferase involved in cellulose biosynthesis